MHWVIIKEVKKTHHGSFVQSLWVECVVPVLCLDEGVAPCLVHLATALEVTKKALVLPPKKSSWQAETVGGVVVVG